MSEIKERTGSDGSHVPGTGPSPIARLVIAAVIVTAGLSSCSSNPSPVVPVSDQQAASMWAQQHAKIWSWMQSHWDEVTLMHQHWGDVPWMQQNLSDYAWMQDHWSDITWMHDHWSGMTWMHTQGMMGSPSGGMMPSI
jgi:hypothetical protein